MKEINIKIRIFEERQKIAWRIERNIKDDFVSSLKLIGILELIKKTEIEKLGEIFKKGEHVNN